MNPTVLVAGAGPVGLAMAAELARYGIPVRIVDKAAQRNDKSKALVLWSRTLELLDRAGCTQAFVDAGLRIPAANIIAGDKHIARIELGDVASPYPYALMLPQSDTERLLEEHLNTLGLQVERGVELTHFTSTQSGVTVTLRHPDCHDETVEAAWLIGCDGAHSTVRHQLDIGFLGDTLKTDWILADLHLANVPSPGEIAVFWHADGILALFPITPTRYRVIADAGPAHTAIRRPDPTLEEIQAVLDQRGPGGIQATDPIWLASFTINERKVADYRAASRIFLAGDAAHIHSPAGGQGMNTGIQDAVNLAWKLALVVRGIAAEEPLLASYSAERSSIGDQVLADAGRVTTIGILRGQVPQFLRNHLAALLFGLSSVRHAAADTLTELSIGYPRSPLTIQGIHPQTGPAPGERAPIRPGETPVGSGTTPRFVLFTDAPIPAELLASFPDLLDPQPRPPFHEDGLWLVRPDGYIALVTETNSWQEVETYLGRIAATRDL